MNRPIQVREFEEAVARAANLDVETIISHSRDENTVAARHAIWYILREYLTYNYSRIAKMYGRDHSTIIYGVGKIRDSEAKQKVDQLVTKERPKIERSLPNTAQARGIDRWQI